MKEDLSKYSITDQTANALGFSDVEEMRIFADSKHILDQKSIIQSQNEE